MPLGARLRCITLFALAVLLAAASAHPQSFDLDHDREHVVSLDGAWRFHPGDSPLEDTTAPEKFLWASPTFDDSNWPLLQSDRSWSVQGYPNMSGYGWYRFTIQLPPGNQPTSLMLAPIITSFQVFVDGRQIGQSGHIPAVLFPNARIIPTTAP